MIQIFNTFQPAEIAPWGAILPTLKTTDLEC